MSSNIVLPQPGTNDFKTKFKQYIKNRIDKDPEFTIECSSGHEKKEFAYQSCQMVYTSRTTIYRNK